MSETIEGRNAVLEALRSGSRMRRILIASGTQPNPVLDEIRTLAAEAGIRVEDTSRQALDKQSIRGAHQGVMAFAEPFAYTPIEDVLRGTTGRSRSLVVVLDHVTDPGNLGAIIRSVEVAGGDAVIVPRDRAAGVGPVAHKAAAGATSHLPVVQVPNVVHSLELLKNAGYWVAGADERSSETLWDAPLEGRIALVLGAEGAGISRLVRERCDFLVSIPVAGQVTSLNVAQAASVLAFEWVRRAR
jgi:23S rRNA (guanosine2251-2'-O)-methyltransferase